MVSLEYPVNIDGWKSPFESVFQKNMTDKGLSNMDFDHDKHISFVPPTGIVTMQDIGYPADLGVSPVAVSQPFQLFSEEAIHKMRSEIFQSNVVKNCKYSSNIAACQLRGYSPKYAPFVYDAWNHPETLQIISKIAQVDLVPEFDLEIGHINIAVKSEAQVRAEQDMIHRQRQIHAEDEGIGGCPWEDDTPVVGWHRDSYPFVCVLMLSDCTNMDGGETALRTATGEIMKVRGPQMGCAVVMQGRYITHQALRALGTAERITMVTSFRPRCPFTRDDTVLSTVRAISNLSELYYDYSEYRLEIMEQRIQAKLKAIRKRRQVGKVFDTTAFKSFLTESEEFLSCTNAEIVEENEVVQGHLDEIAFPEDRAPL